MISSTSHFHVYLASIYHSLLVNAAKTVKKKKHREAYPQGELRIWQEGRPELQNWREQVQEHHQGFQWLDKGPAVFEGRICVVVVIVTGVHWKKTHEKQLEQVQRRALHKVVATFRTRHQSKHQYPNRPMCKASGTIHLTSFPTQKFKSLSSLIPPQNSVQVQLQTLERVRRVIHRSFGNLVDNPDLQLSTFPPSYEVAMRTPPPYSAIDTQAQNDIDTIDTVEPTPQYDVEYAPLEDVGMAGFLCSELATIFEEDEDEAVE
ncbi:hypothetical protein IW261DRAFT_1672278 [Armillaria novae-zelandiae]|uniref:Uncharacterized protein n=1 Tax=Armillaria novae-zelandiae TaxID=153914 RepID=A0AA39NS38_9AGAR|nr:hypothetical protein IW261DRAFT_1672278 [Armillaria novae-zelandiae]